MRTPPLLPFWTSFRPNIQIKFITYLQNELSLIESQNKSGKTVGFVVSFFPVEEKSRTHIMENSVEFIVLSKRVRSFIGKSC